MSSDHLTFLKSLSADQRNELTTTNDLYGLLNLAVHLAILIGFGSWIASGAFLWQLALLPQGIAMAFLFTLQHECTHRTPFKSPWVNELVGQISGFLIVQPFEWFRAFHFAHHRHTNEPDNDPELQSPKPETNGEIFWHILTLSYWFGKLRVLFANASNPKREAYITERQIPRLKREARLMLLGYALVAVSLLFSLLAFWVWLFPLFIGFPFLRIYLLAEHGRCPQVANMFDNTRTTLTNRIVKQIAWNMPYHAEHHAFPTVPFHKLPELHALTKPHLQQISDGYTEFTKEYLSSASVQDKT